MFKNIMGRLYEYNTKKPVLFSSRLDCGYYISRKKCKKLGAVSLSVQLDERLFRSLRGKITGFGFFSGEDGAAVGEPIAQSAEADVLSNRNGAFNIVICDIPEADFDKTVRLIPFVSAKSSGGETIFAGNAICAGVICGAGDKKNVRRIIDVFSND